MRTCVNVVSLSLMIVSTCLSQDTIQVKAGWNNIGAISAGAVGDLLVSSPPGIVQTAFFGYEPGSGYQTADTLEKGSGYWIKVSEDGIVIFNPEPVLDSCSTPEVAFEGGPYPTVKIGNQCWLAKNLNVGTMITGSQQDNAVTEKYCYNDDTANCAAYGGLYERDEAALYAGVPGTQGICPPGWHVPTSLEYGALLSAVGGDANALKAVGQGSGPGAGTDTSGFSGLLSGIRDPGGSFFFIGQNGYFSTSTWAGASHYFIAILAGSSNAFVTDEAGEKSYAGSVRCVQD